jgi:hypothetical protein
MHRLIAFPRAVAAFLTRCGVFLVRRSIVLALGACLGYAYGYDHARVGQPSLYTRAEASAQSLIGWDHVREDHESRQRAIEAIRQARADSLQALLPH